MRKDPAIDEIRQVRKEISREYETTEDFLNHYRELEKSYESRMLRSGSRQAKARPKVKGRL